MKIDLKKPLNLILGKHIVNNKPSLEFLKNYIYIYIYICTLSCIHTHFSIMRIWNALLNAP